MVSPANNINNPSQEKKIINLELWQACAGPLVNLPVAGTHVVYFPQGHSEQVAASMKKDVDAQIPNYPNLPSKLLCLLHSVTLHADPETDEVFAQMTLQPVPNFDKEGLLRSDLSLKSNKPQTEFFCKTLTASDTSTHGGFSVPRRAAEKIFPPLDFTMQPPAQELVARDLHDNVWTFRHIFRGQPKRHLLTTGWSLFVSGKRLFAGDSVLFIRDEKQHLLLGIRRANRQPPNLSSSVLSSDSMHIGILAAAANAAANNSIFTVFYNPRTSPSEFVIPLAKYYKAVNSYQISLGMRFRMMFETEESGTRRYMGTITGINDLDAVRWKNSQWRNLQVGWDESTAGERRSRVSIWEIEPVTAPFFICPPPFFRSKRPRQPGMPDNECSDLDSLFKRTMPWLGDDMCMKDPQALPGFSLAQWMNMQQAPSLANSIQPSFMQTIPGPVMQNFTGADISHQLGLSASQISQHTNLHFSGQKQSQQVQQIDQPSRIPPTMNPLSSMFQQQLADTPLQPRQILINQTMPSTQVQSQILQPQISQEPNILQQQSSVQSHQFPRILPPVIHQQHQHQHLAPPQIISQNQQQNLISPQAPNQVNQQLQMPENQIQYQLLQNLQPQRQTILAQQSTLQNPAQAILLNDQQQMQGDTSQSFSRPLIPNTMVETQQPTTTSLPQSLNAPQQSTKNNSQMNGQFSTLLEQSNIPPRQSPGMAHELNGNIGLPPHLIINHNQPSTAGSSALTGAAGGHSAITEDVPSCSTSPSTNNCPNSVQIKVNNRTHRSTTTGEEMAQSASLLLSPRALGTMSSSINLVKDIQPKSGIKPSLTISKDQNSGFFSQQPYLHVPAAQTDYLETSSSATSVSFSQNDAHLQHNSHPSSFIPHSMLFRDLSQDGEVLGGPRSNISFGTHIDDQLGMPLNHESVLTKGGVGLGKDFSNGVPSGEMLPKYEYSKEHQQELSSSIISQSFGVPDITFNSIDSALNDSSFLNRGPLAPPTQQFQRIRTYTKVYKRGAVGRSIDITRYSGYDELKQDLARRFGIEGQLEDRHRIGWKLVYVDHENDVLLVGDDPWEEFVNCVRCIKILSPQEVQQMSLDGDIGSSLLPNQACSSSDGGNI